MSVKLQINGVGIEARNGDSILDAATAAGIYIPQLCAHPDLPPGGVCGLCVVELAGGEVVKACETIVEDGMVVVTENSGLIEQRKEGLSQILANHPHACLTCAQREGCSRTQCSSNVPEEGRCCSKFGNCEIQRMAEFIGIKDSTPRYNFLGLKVVKDEPLFSRDYNLCIGCTRCLRACNDVRGVGALQEVVVEGRTVVMPKAKTLAESGCRFCGACVEVCPTGTLLDKGPAKGPREVALVPCRKGCPAGIDVPMYIRAINEENYATSLQIIKDKVPFPGVLGRVCFHPCETVCRRKEIDSPVSICRLKRFVADEVKEVEIPSSAAESSGSVAVVGSGPAGLSAAYFLALAGVAVTVFEAEEQPGGMLRLGIPEYRLPRNVLDREIRMIKAIGVEIKTNNLVNDLAGLEKEFDAVFVGVGAMGSKKLGIAGEDDPAVWSGISFLHEVNVGETPEPGKRVVVIGGGNVAIDAARSALRLGAEEVTVYYRRGSEEMPAFAQEVTEALEEGVKIEYLRAPGRVVRNGDTLCLELCKTELGDKDSSGRASCHLVAGSNYLVEVDNIIAAVGQDIDLPSTWELGANQVKVDKRTMETSRKGVYAGGDVVLGPSSVIEAIAQGRQAAMAILEKLGIVMQPATEVAVALEVSAWIGPDDEFVSRKRPGLLQRPWLKGKAKGEISCGLEENRNVCFGEVELGFDEPMAMEEAVRCLQCDLRLQLRAVQIPPAKDDSSEFSKEKIASVPEKDGVFELLTADKEIIYIGSGENLREALLEQLDNDEEWVEEVKYFTYEEDPMFSKRESELMQKYLQKHGGMPVGNSFLDDLF